MEPQPVCKLERELDETYAAAELEEIARLEEAAQGLQLDPFYDQYDTLGQIGEGAQGEIHLVRDRETGKEYAAKILVLERGKIKWEQVKGLEREAEAQQKIDSPYIPKCHGFMTAHNPLYKRDEFVLIYDYIEGKSLAERLDEREKFTEETLIDYLEQSLKALDAVHHAEFVHRDVKPANIKVTVDGRLYLTDFGIAKDLDQITRASTLGAGTLGYMAPEQFGVGKIVPETDYYGLAATIITLASGKEESRIAENPGQNTQFLKERLSKSSLSPEFKQRLEYMLNNDPEERKKGLDALVKVERTEDIENDLAGEKQHYPEDFYCNIGANFGVVSGLISMPIAYGFGIEGAMIVGTGVGILALGAILGASVQLFQDKKRGSYSST
ncbi:MAG: serine/threonine-protein kinase [Nanoarchaeota archaeon]